MRNNEQLLIEKLKFKEALYEILTIASSSTHVNALLQSVLNKVLDVPWVNIEKKGVIFLVNPEGNLELIAHKNTPSLVKSCSTVKKGECLCGIVLEKRKEIYCDHVTHDHSIHPEGMTDHGHYVLPILLNGEVLGVLTTYTVKGEAHNPQVYKFLNAVTEILANRIFVLNETKRVLAEKDLLIKEIHHRIKNNLQIISSLLSLQSNFINNSTQCEIILSDAKDRIKAISLIHDNILSDKPRFVSIKEYFEKFMFQFESAHRLTDRNISYSLSIEDFNLPISIAVPLALLTNEIISNSIKHAFEEFSNGKITIHLSTTKSITTLVIKDSGKGLPKSFSLESHDSLGSVIIRSLAEQLNGDIKYQNENGAKFELIFDTKKLSRMVKEGLV